MDSEINLTRFTKHPDRVKDVVVKKNAPENLARSIVARDLLLERTRKELSKNKVSALIDVLTGLNNRRWLLGDSNVNPPRIGELQRYFLLAQRHNWPLTVFMIDFDSFKQYNDVFGHQEGDLALQNLASVLRRSTRKTDLCARYGGEEFVIVLPQTIYENANKLAEKVRRAVETNPNFKRKSTISIGISSFDPLLQDGISSADELIRRADNALYEAKKQGRNQVQAYVDNKESNSPA